MDRYEQKARILVGHSQADWPEECRNCEKVAMIAQALRGSAADEINNMISIMTKRNEEVYDLTVDAWICGMKARAAALAPQGKEEGK